MSYAGARRILDADSHLMELPDFLSAHADRSIRERLHEVIGRGESFGLDDVELRRDDGPPAHLPRVVDELLARGDDLLRGPKWYSALGAFNGKERGRALDLLGFERQVIFSSLTAAKIFAVEDQKLAYAAARAHNRAMGEFCSADARLLGVGVVMLDDVPAALIELDAALEVGIGAFWIPTRAPGGRSPGHPEHDPFWERLVEARVPFILHVGSAPLAIAREWMNDGQPEWRSARGGPEVIGSKDLSVIYQPYERFLSVLVLDGVLERFSGLRGGCIEVGAGWVPAMLRRLDHAVEIWSRSEPQLGEMQRCPSEQIREQLRFTPYAFEDVGQLIRESNDELYLFSSDYPHAEGGRDPLARFERSLGDLGEQTRERFYAGNLAQLLDG